MKCICADWIRYIQRIDNMMLLPSILSGIRADVNPLGNDYKGFLYCPWCGKKLKP